MPSSLTPCAWSCARLTTPCCFLATDHSTTGFYSCLDVSPVYPRSHIQRGPPAASAGGLDRDDVASADVEGDLVGRPGLRAVPDEEIAARRPGPSAGEAPRAPGTPVGLEGNGRRVTEDLDVAADPHAAAPAAGAAGALPELVAPHPQGVGVLERLGGGGLRVGHPRQVTVPAPR